MCCSCCTVKQQQIWAFTVGTILVIIGIIFITAWPTLFEELLYSMLPLSPTSYMFSKWEITPIPLYINFYMFNWTNSQMANDSSVKPNFAELGPYVFREVRVKEDLKWNNDENIVTFFSRRTFYFEAAKSNGSLEDMITAPHLPTMTGAKMFKNLHPIPRKIVNFALNREGGKLASTQSVKEWTFDGFYDDLMDLVVKLHSPILGIDENHFAYLYKRNGSQDAEGTFSMYTGKGHLYNMGDLKYWNSIDHTKYWDGECGRVNGTTGELWAPNKKWHDPVSFFDSDISRFLNIYPQRNETYRGVEARRYTSSELTFDSGHRVKDTECFCVKGRECPKAGVVDFSPPSKNAPLYISHPHFNMADPIFSENTTGLSPDPDKHIITILLEPKLGIPLYVDGRIFVSTLVEQDHNIDILKDLAWNFYAPLFTIQIKTAITDDILRMVKFVLNLPKLGQYLGIAFTTIGVLVIGVGIYVTIKSKWHKELIELEKINN